jgi:hypothetical protein
MSDVPKGLTPSDPASLPDMLAAAGKKETSKYRVRYQKLNMDELGDITELERIETKVLHGEDFFVMSKKDFVFMDKVFILVCYLEPVEA